LAKSPKNTPISQPGGAESDAVGNAPYGHGMDDRIAELVVAWPRLSERVREAILILAENPVSEP